MPEGDSLPKGEDKAATEKPQHPITKAVTDMLQRHGVAKGDLAAVISEKIGVTTQSARRRLNDESGWSHTDIAKLARLCGEDPLPIVAGDFQGGAPIQGRVEIDDISLPCSFWPDPSFTGKNLVGPMVALAPLGSADGEPWSIVPIDQRGERSATSVQALFVDFALFRRRVAVIDDEPSVADGIAALLRLKGMDATSFSNAEDFKHVHETRPFDAFVVDWLLASGNARELITAIRASNRRAPLIVLTGRIGTKDVRERDVDAAVHAVDGELMEKPAKILRVMRYLQKGLGT